MQDYINARIYKLVSGSSPAVYIGSTCVSHDTPNERLEARYRDLFTIVNSKPIRAPWYDICKHSDAHIEFVETCPCNSKDELDARKRWWILNTPCVVNTKMPRVSPDERKEYARAYYHTYYIDHKDEKAAKRKHADKDTSTVQCGCGSTVLFTSRIAHYKSQKHLRFVASGHA